MHRGAGRAAGHIALVLCVASPILAHDARGADAGNRRECAAIRVCGLSDAVSTRFGVRLAQAKLERGQPAERSDETPVYRPPRRGSPRTRVGGGIRTGRALPELQVLTPDHLAETVNLDPSLFWHIDSVPAQSAKLVFTLIDDVGIDPLVEVVLPTPDAAGIQRIRLADHAVQLDSQKEYEWSVSLVTDPDDRTRDVVSTGFIRRVAAPAEPVTSTAAYAELGLWYDALETISDAIEASPNDGALRDQRAALLRQAGLESAVE